MGIVSGFFGVPYALAAGAISTVPEGGRYAAETTRSLWANLLPEGKKIGYVGGFFRRAAGVIATPFALVGGGIFGFGKGLTYNVNKQWKSFEKSPFQTMGKGLVSLLTGTFGATRSVVWRTLKSGGQFAWGGLKRTAGYVDWCTRNSNGRRSWNPLRYLIAAPIAAATGLVGTAIAGVIGLGSGAVEGIARAPEDADIYAKAGQDLFSPNQKNTQLLAKSTQEHQALAARTGPIQRFRQSLAVARISPTKRGKLAKGGASARGAASSAANLRRAQPVPLSSPSGPQANPFGPQSRIQSTTGRLDLSRKGGGAGPSPLGIVPQGSIPPINAQSVGGTQHFNPSTAPIPEVQWEMPPSRSTPSPDTRPHGAAPPRTIPRGAWKMPTQQVTKSASLDSTLSSDSLPEAPILPGGEFSSLGRSSEALRTRTPREQQRGGPDTEVTPERRGPTPPSRTSGL